MKIRSRSQGNNNNYNYVVERHFCIYQRQFSYTSTIYQLVTLIEFHANFVCLFVWQDKWILVSECPLWDLALCPTFMLDITGQDAFGLSI